MIPAKLSSKVFLELPPVLAHYLEGPRNTRFEANPQEGKIGLLGRSGVFSDLEALAVERRHLVEIVGPVRARGLVFRMGFEQGRRDARRQCQLFDDNGRLVLQAGLVFMQMQGRFVAENIRFEFDLEARTLYRETLLHSSVEALAHRMLNDQGVESACWLAAGYLSGHVSEVLGRRVLTLEHECAASGHPASGRTAGGLPPACRLISRLDGEWGHEADWARQALSMESIERELSKRDADLAKAQQAAKRAQGELGQLTRRMRTEMSLDNLVAESEAMQTVIKRARQVAGSDVPVFFTGEPGTGRGALARAIHRGGSRKNGPFEAVDCAGLSDTLLRQELFGFAKDAFPGASRPYAGAVARGHKGTLYLDEITRLSAEAQGLLLRVLSERKVMPLGATEPIPADVRVIVSTQHNPQESVRAGELREDLYYALSIARIDVPPLRERGTDILRLAELFLSECRERYERPAVSFAEGFKQALLDCAWPGNVRQLRNVVEHAVVFGHDGELDAGALPEDVLATRWVRQSELLSDAVVRATLRRTRGNRSQAAELLGVGRTTLWRAMKRLSIE